MFNFLEDTAIGISAFVVDTYFWLLAFHVIAVIAWMAAMLYLPRLYVYHCRVAPGSEASELLKVMERKLLRVIMNPAMITAWVLGLTLSFSPGIWSSGWFHTKLLLLLLLSGVHGMFSKWRRDFAHDRNRRSERFYRVMNEVPTLLMIAIVILAVVKPF